MRHFTLLAVGMALAAAFVQAPSAHMHAYGRHVGPFLHTHAPLPDHAPSQDPEWRAYDPNADALFLNWSVSSPVAWTFTAVTLPDTQIILPLPDLGEWREPVLLPNAHAPPPLTALTPRAPPV